MYEIKVLNNDEFDEISRSDPRYSHVDGTNLGFADRITGKAYVRDTHIHDLNKYLINHELEELEMDESTHEDPNGIRHKKGPKFFKEILAPLFTGFNLETKKFSPFGILDPSISKANQPKEPEIPQEPAQFNFSPFSQFVPGSTGPSGGPSITSSQRIPETLTGGVQPGLNKGAGAQGIPPEILNKLRSGNYGGRFVF